MLDCFTRETRAHDFLQYGKHFNGAANPFNLDCAVNASFLSNSCKCLTLIGPGNNPRHSEGAAAAAAAASAAAVGGGGGGSGEYNMGQRKCGHGSW